MRSGLIVFLYIYMCPTNKGGDWLDIHCQRRKRKIRIAEIPFLIIGIICTIAAPLLGVLSVITLVNTYKADLASAIVAGVVIGFAFLAAAIFMFRHIAKMEAEIDRFEAIAYEQRMANKMMSRVVDE